MWALNWVRNRNDRCGKFYCRVSCWNNELYRPSRLARLRKILLSKLSNAAIAIKAKNGSKVRIAAISAGRTKCPLPQLVLANTINPE